MKREEPQDQRSRKGEDPQLSFDEPVGSITDSTPTVKDENKMLVSCPGRDQDTPLSIEGNTDVVLALNCPELSCPTPKRRRRLSNPFENHNPDQDLVKKGQLSLTGTAYGNATNTGNVSKIKVHNQKVKINKSLKAASKSVDKQKELNMVQQRKRTRERKWHTDPGIKCQLGSGDPEEDTMENMPDIFDGNRSSEVASETAKEEKRVCADQQIGMRLRVRKRCTEQENNHLEIVRNSLSDTLEISNSGQNLVKKKSDLPDEFPSPEAASGKTDEQKEVRAVQKKEKKKKRVQKRCTDLEKDCQLKIGETNLSDSLQTSNSDQKLIEKKSPDENQSTEAEQKVVCAILEKPKKKRSRKKVIYQEKECQSEIGEWCVPSSDQNMMEKLDLSDQNKSSEAATNMVDEQKEVCTVRPKRKRCNYQEKKRQFENGRSNCHSLETTNLDQNLAEKKSVPAESKSSEAATNIANDQKEVCAVQQKMKRTRSAKRCFDQENRHQLVVGHSGQTLIKVDAADEVKSLEAALDIVDEQKEVSKGQQKKRRTRAVKRCIDQENKHQLVIGQTSNAEKISTEKKLDFSDATKGQEAVSETADEQKEGCAVQQKKRRTRSVKRFIDQENKHQLTIENKHQLIIEQSNLSNSLQSSNSDQSMMEKRLDPSGETKGLEAASVDELKEVSVVQKKKRTTVGKRRSDQENKPQVELSSAGCVNMNLTTKNQTLGYEDETPILDVKNLQTYQRKDKKCCSMDDNLETGRDEGSVEASVNNTNCLENKRKVIQDDELNVIRQVVPGARLYEEEKPRLQTNFSDSNLKRLKEAGPASDEVFLDCSTDSNSPTCPVNEKVMGSTHQDKNLRSDSRHNICDDHLPLESESDFVNDACADTLKVKSEMGNLLELCKESCNSTLEDSMLHSVDESSANHPSEKSASSKRQKQEKIGHNSHEVIASDDLLNVLPSVTQASSSSEGTSKEFLGECQMEKIDPSSDVIKNDVGLVRTDIIENQLPKRPTSPERASIGHTGRKLLILDLNGILVDIVSVLPKGYTADKMISRRALLRRPFCDDFLKFCFERFNVGVWSSRNKKNVDSVVDYIMGDMRHKLLFCWHQSHCTETGFQTVEDVNKPILFKELKKLWDKHEEPYDPNLPWEKGEYNESNTLLLDDSPYKALLNPPFTAIFPPSYVFQNKNDNSLGPDGDLRVYLERLALAENVQKFIEENPFGQRAITSKNASWLYYLRIINANNFCLPT